MASVIRKETQEATDAVVTINMTTAVGGAHRPVAPTTSTAATTTDAASGGGGGGGGRREGTFTNIAIAPLPLENKADTPVAAAGPSRRRSGKEIIEAMGTKEEKKPLIVNMARVRRAAPKRFLVVGVFLAVLAITSKSLIDNMKNIWKIRGCLDTNQLRDRRFVLEFSEEGDFLHVTRGGPWRFRDDAVVVDVLNEVDDHEEVQFNSIPIWVQFKKIPFYLLSKQLAKDLGAKIGTFICIDINLRGDICDKIIRARVRLPINQALQRWTMLLDEIEDEEVVVSIAYERLPNFCLFCGFIGHEEAECRIPVPHRKRRYSRDLGVAPIHPEDIRSWPMPNFTGQERQRLALPWKSTQNHLRQPPKTVHQRQLAIVAHIASGVEKLSVQDLPPTGNQETNVKAPSTTTSTTPKQPSKQALDQAGTVVTVTTTLP
ncbi:hypothetical protein ACQ4PT_057045 [Festuca glaucescens]